MKFQTTDISGVLIIDIEKRRRQVRDVLAQW
jgi:hypothetical protein